MNAQDMSGALRRKLAALRELSKGRGASEAEAMAAAEKMASLLQEHGLTENDVEFDEVRASLKTKRVSARTSLAAVIGACTNCAVTLDHGEAIYTGRAPGPEIAGYLVAVCDGALDRAAREFKASGEYRRRRTVATRRQAGKDFTTGMVDRLSSRLLSMFRPTMSQDAVKAARCVSDERRPGCSSVKLPERKVKFGGAARAGDAAGRDVHLARGVNAGRELHQISHSGPDP